MISPHSNNKEVNKRKYSIPMKYMVITMSIGYNIHDE